MAEYTNAVDIDVRFRDMDPMGHVNNAVYATYLEHARARYYREVTGVALADLPTVLVRLEIDYRRAITQYQDVVVCFCVPALGESSVPMDYEIRADGEVAAAAKTVQVFVDGETGESTPIPEQHRERIAEHEGL